MPSFIDIDELHQEAFEHAKRLAAGFEALARAYESGSPQSLPLPPEDLTQILYQKITDWMTKDRPEEWVDAVGSMRAATHTWSVALSKITADASARASLVRNYHALFDESFQDSHDVVAKCEVVMFSIPGTEHHEVKQLLNLLDPDLPCFEQDLDEVLAQSAKMKQELMQRLAAPASLAPKGKTPKGM